MKTPHVVSTPTVPFNPSYSLLVRNKMQEKKADAQGECLKTPFTIQGNKDQGHLSNLSPPPFKLNLPSHNHNKPPPPQSPRSTMKLDKEIFHPSHPHHMLKIDYTETPFSCDGCMEAGIGLKYTCVECEFDLHKVCAMASPFITHHFYKKCEFDFYAKPPGSKARFCDACGRDVVGFVYHCKGCGFDLHPCCASLPQVLEDGERSLHLCMKLSSACHRCGRKGLGWCYRSECKSYNLHVSCVKEMLVESWQAMYLNVDKNKVREMQTRIPSLGAAIDNHHHRKGKVKKCCQIAGGAVRVVVSAILGDPTAIIAAVVGGFISK